MAAISVIVMETLQASQELPEVILVTSQMSVSALETHRRILNMKSFGEGDAYSQTKPATSRSMRLMFIPFYLWGIVESPSILWVGRSSVFYKLYSSMICFLTLVGWLRTSYLVYRHDEDPLLSILKPKLTFYCRLIYTIVAFKAFCVRLVCFVLFNFEHRRIADAYLQITSEYSIIKFGGSLISVPIIPNSWRYVASGTEETCEVQRTCNGKLI